MAQKDSRGRKRHEWQKGKKMALKQKGDYERY